MVRRKRPDLLPSDIQTLDVLLGPHIEQWYDEADRFALIRVGPELAAKLLEFNDHNRRARPFLMSLLETELSEGVWAYRVCMVLLTWTEENGPRRPRLMDGQHRLTAIVNTGAEVLMQVRWGMDPRDSSKVDVGAKRTASDIARLEGLANPALATAIAARLMVWEVRATMVVGQRPFPRTVVAYAWDHLDEVQSACRYAQGIYNRIRYNPSEMGMALVVFRRSLHDRFDVELATETIDLFATRLMQGDLPETPISYFREKILHNAASKKEGTWDAEQKMQLLIRTWNAWIRDGSKNSVRLRDERPGIALPTNAELSDVFERCGQEPIEWAEG